MISIDDKTCEITIELDSEHPTLKDACNRLTDPTWVDFDLCLRNNKLTSLEGIVPEVGHNLWCYNNMLTSLHNIHKHLKYVGISIGFRSNPIKSHILGLLLIDGLQRIFLDNKEIEEIINKHLKHGKDIFACQEELIEAGFDNFAQL